MFTSRSLTLEVNGYSQHLAKDLIGGTSIIYIYNFFFCFQTLLLNSDRKGPFQPTFSMKITFRGLTAWNVFGWTLNLVLKTKKKTVVQKLKLKTKCVSITKQAFVNKYRDIEMDISYRSPYYSSIRLGLRSSITIIHVKIKSIITFIT